MPGVHPHIEPVPATDTSVADETTQLKLSLQSQFEEDIARIFDESIYSDFELVSGRSRILTHTCILKARTHNVFQKLEALPNRNINPEAYDEIYSFISDAYTECSLLEQEQHIISYLDIKKTNTHSNNCILIKRDSFNNSTSVAGVATINKQSNLRSVVEKVLEVANSPDSLVPDDPSSSSDYLSAGYSFSSAVDYQLNVEKPLSRMAHMFTSSDSGLENTESVNTIQQDATVNDMAISTCTASKEEKQRQNEEIVTLESSSVSSETGSWESVFPPKQGDKELCVAFLNKERHNSSSNVKLTDENLKQKVSHFPDDLTQTLEQRSPFKTTSCFIDAATLVDDEDTTIIQNNVVDPIDVLPAPSQPMPCHKVKNDISPNDWSESHDNDDSLELLDQKDPDSLQRDMSPTIFDMTPITEDSLSTNVFEEAALAEKNTKSTEPSPEINSEKNKKCLLQTKNILASTPNNSILSLSSCRLQNKDSEDGDSDSTLVSQEGSDGFRYVKKRFDLFSPIVSAEDNVKSSQKLQKSSNVSAWVVDMSSEAKSVQDKKIYESKKPLDRNHEIVRNELRNSNQELGCKSRSSVDSDSSERSSHKFYIDLSSLPDPSPPKEETNSKSTNIFSMYIDLGEKSSIKEMPARLSSSLNIKRNTGSPKTSPSPKVKSGGKPSYRNVQENQDKSASRESTPSRSLKKSNVTSNPKYHGKSNIVSANFSSSADSSINVPSQNLSFFEKYEALCEDPQISISEIIKMPKPVNKSPELRSDLTVVTEEDGDHQRNRAVTSMPLNTTTDVFVRLSDLDKPNSKINCKNSNEKCVTDIRMTRSIPDSNWCEPGYNESSRFIEVISSFHSENTLSLNRLFPHLKNEFSTSMPGSLSNQTRSPMRRGTSCSNGEMEVPTSDMSEVSSGQSSFTRSVIENSTTDESQTYNLIGTSQSRLGEDLLRMFREEIAPDVIVEVSGRQFKAHKCILSSRCQYFAAILSGDWVKNAGDVIHLPFSPDVVHFTLCHIYSGVSSIPDHISIVELATLADMLGLEGLKEAIMFTLKFKYCHNFHKPCQVCICGALECFCLSSAYGLDELYHKCLKWITKYFQKIWPTKTFATLPKDLQDKCYQQHVVNFTTETVIDTVCGCGTILATLPKARWAEIVDRMVREVMTSGAYFVASNLSAVIRATATVSQHLPSPALHAIEKCLADAIERAPPDEACRTYAYLFNIIKKMRSLKPDLITSGDLPAGGTLLFTYANQWRLQTETSIVRSAPRALKTQAYQDLPDDLRKRLRELGCIKYGATSTSLQEVKKPSARISKWDVEQVRANFVPYSRKPPAQATVPRRVPAAPLSAILPKIKTTKTQEERVKHNLTQIQKSQDLLKNKVSSGITHRYENTKPRYLEPRPNKDKKSPINRLSMKMVSSSESSRNSSPNQSRKLRSVNTKPLHSGSSQAMSQDSLVTSSRPLTAEPSTDSLTETNNRFATYTKTKHPSRLSSCTRQTTTAETSQLKLAGKTKIPVYQKHHVRSEIPKKYTNDKPVYAQARSTTATNVRKYSGSLMMATKSSLAKVVPKTTKEQQIKCDTKHLKTKNSTQTAMQSSPIPAMDRSGTFLKDEPTFGDKTTNIDLFQ